MKPSLVTQGVWAYNRRETSRYFPRDSSQRDSFLEMRMRPSCSSEVRGRADARWRRQGKVPKASHRLVKQRARSSHKQRRQLRRRNGQTNNLAGHRLPKRVCEVRVPPSFADLLIICFINCEDSQRQRLLRAASETFPERVFPFLAEREEYMHTAGVQGSDLK